jgi:predicted metalloenzyme YecM
MAALEVEHCIQLLFNAQGEQMPGMVVERKNPEAQVTQSMGFVLEQAIQLGSQKASVLELPPVNTRTYPMANWEASS